MYGRRQHIDFAVPLIDLDQIVRRPSLSNFHPSEFHPKDATIVARNLARQCAGKGSLRRGYPAAAFATVRLI